MSYWCNVCEEDITKEEYDYSVNKYKRALCRQHQNGNSNNKVKEMKSGYNKKEPTKEAKMLGKLLEEKGWKVEFEKWDGYKHIDIAIVEARVNLEIDGSHHNTEVKQALADLQRTYHSFKKGYLTLRIPNCLVKDELIIYKTAHFVDTFLNQSAEMLDKEEKEAEKKGGFFEWIMGKKIKSVQ